MKASYHNHTPLCRHATGDPKEYAEAAYRAGCETFGFSDHTPYPFRGGYLSGCRMRLEEVDGYIRTVSELREEYRGKMDIKIGFETEYYPALFDKLLDLYRTLPIDYIILGQHGFGAPEDEPDGWINSFTEHQSPETIEKFTNTMVEAIETGRFSVVAHPDVLKLKGDTDLYREQMGRIIRAANRQNIPLEINLYGLIDHRHYPNGIFWDEVAKIGAKVLLGRDAHATSRIGNREEISAAMAFAKAHKIDDMIVEDTVLVKPNV